MKTLGDLVDDAAVLPPQWASVPILGLTADSREVAPGFLFAALPGTATHGRHFIPEAIRRGAVAILGERKGDVPDPKIPLIVSRDPRRSLARMAARFYERQPGTVVAVTGTNGKTSVAAFTRQIWAAMGHEAASLGTVGVETARAHAPLPHTTPEPVRLHKTLAELAEAGITHLALEASSHGLAQRRLDGLRLAAAAFTNISRDHLDYHTDFNAYFQEKMRLFRELLPPRAPVVVDRDAPGAGRVVELVKNRGLPLISVGHRGRELKLLEVERDGFAQRLHLSAQGREMVVTLPLVGAFQAANALVAAGLVMATGGAAEEVIPHLVRLKGAKGRLEMVGETPDGAPVFVDYAHTPDALANALDALEPYVTGRLLVVFGCGGDRDPGKRPQMGTIAREKAHVVVVTDDNPRSEDPAKIRAEIRQAVPDAQEIPDRREAIHQAIRWLKRGDVLLIAGKGHETGQIVGEKVHPFSDHAVVAEALADLGSENKGEGHG